MNWEGTKCFDFIESIMLRDNMIQSDDSDFWCCSVNGVSISYNKICQLCRFVVLSSFIHSLTPSSVQCDTVFNRYFRAYWCVFLSFQLVRILLVLVAIAFVFGRLFFLSVAFSFFFCHVIVLAFFPFVLSLLLYLSHSISNCLEISAFSLSYLIKRLWSQ